ncbi:glucose 1-dehydrogenase [Candidatus Woesearchaeota archaeon]|nr:glucose 1-dehydrogenase [Candidatus Woesearchaeota archaeon]
MRLYDKVAIVTGASSGIGKAIAQSFAKEHAYVAIVARSQKGAEAVQQITAEGGKALFVQCDVTNATAVEAMVSSVIKEYGRIDILVNNAGILRNGDVVSLQEKDWDDVIATDLKSVYLCSKYVIPIMRKNKSGSIVNVASYFGLLGGRQVAAYCAAKGGVVNLTRAMALDHSREGIRVNALCPGPVETQLLQKTFPTPESMKKVAAQIPRGQFPTLEEIASAALFLASDESKHITGIALPIDGGGSAGIKII